jgi:hypothetical protein
MLLYQVKYLKFFWTMKYSVEQKYEWYLSVLWLFLAIVTFCMNCLDRVVLAHPFRTLATFPVCSFVLSCWTNRTPSVPSSSYVLPICTGSFLFSRVTHCPHGHASMSVDVSTICLPSWSYHFFSQSKQIHISRAFVSGGMQGYAYP